MSSDGRRSVSSDGGDRHPDESGEWADRETWSTNATGHATSSASADVVETRTPMFAISPASSPMLPTAAVDALGGATDSNATWWL